MSAQRVLLRPGDTIEVVVVERLVNGYDDEQGSVTLHWQERDAPPGEVAKRRRELQIAWQSHGKVGPIVLTAPDYQRHA